MYTYDLPSQFRSLSACDANAPHFAEAALQRLLKNAVGCRATEPRSAQLYYVPFDILCLHAEFRKTQSPDAVDARLNALFVELMQWLRRFPYFQLAPHKHVFPFVSSRGPLLVHQWQMHLARSILLVPLEFSVHPAFNRSNHIVVPSFVPRVDELRAEGAHYAVGDAHARPTLAYWSGAVTNDLRQRLARLYPYTNNASDETPIRVYVDSLIQTHNAQWRRSLTRSRFCLVLRGDTDHISTLSKVALNIHAHMLAFWGKLDEMLFAGCIPALVCDSCTLPFADLIDWRSFVLKLHEVEINEKLTARMQSLFEDARDVLPDVTKAMDDVTPFLRYPATNLVRQYSLEPSPLTAMLHVILARMRSQLPGARMPVRKHPNQDTDDDDEPIRGLIDESD